MKWIEALKKWNASRGGRYTVPRKGTPEHAEVKELMEGGSKASGYVRLLYAKNVNNKSPDDYDPPAREKKADSKWRPDRISDKSDDLIESYGTITQKRAMAVRQGRIYKGPKEEEAPAPPPVPAVKFPSQEEFKKLPQRERFSIMTRATKEKDAGRSIPAWLETSIKKSDATLGKKRTGVADISDFMARKAVTSSASPLPVPSKSDPSEKLIESLYDGAWKAKARKYLSDPSVSNYKALLSARFLPRVSTSQEATGKTKDNIAKLLSLNPPSESVRKEAEKQLRAERKPAKTSLPTASKPYDHAETLAMMSAESKRAGDVAEADEHKEDLITFLMKERKLKVSDAETEATRLIKLKGGAKKKTYTAEQAKKDMKALGVKTKKDKKGPVKETGQISVMMRIGNHTMVAEPQPATIKVKGNLGELKTDSDFPASGYTGFEDRPRETTRTQATRKFSPEETKVRPLSELFMTKPPKGLVEEQLQGKGCWWMKDLHEI